MGYKDEYLSTKRGYNLLRFFNPLPCMTCNEMEFVESGPFCEECYEQFEKILMSSCSMCGGDKDECKCFNISGIKKMYFLFWYERIRGAYFVSKIKYGGDHRYISYFGKLIAEEIMKRESKILFDGVCFVPRSPKNVKERGFDQSKLLAESVAYYLGLPVLNCLKRVGKAEEQKKLSGGERRLNVKNKFDVSFAHLVNEHGEIPSKVLLIDDVVTTGSTIRECSYHLRKSSVRSVFVGAIASTPVRKYKKRRYKRKKY